MDGNRSGLPEPDPPVVVRDGAGGGGVRGEEAARGVRAGRMVVEPPRYNLTDEQVVRLMRYLEETAEEDGE